MPLDGSGSYTPPSPEFPAVGGTDILASDFNAIINDLKSALDKAFFRDGQASMTAAIAMGGFKVTGVADATAAQDVTSLAQVQALIAAIPAGGDGGSYVPVGTIVPWIGGYFGAGDNSGFVNVLGNSVAAANSYLNPNGWYVCNGAPVAVVDAPVFNVAYRYTPNLTDSRFIQGSTSVSGVGGSNSLTISAASHSHSFSISGYVSATALTTDQIPAHTHNPAGQLNFVGGNSNWPSALLNVGSGYYNLNSGLLASVGGNAGHDHYYSGSGTTGSASGSGETLENRPLFLSTLFIIKVI